MTATLERVLKAKTKTTRINRWAKSKVEHIVSQLTNDVRPDVEQLCNWLAWNHDGRFEVHYMFLRKARTRPHVLRLLGRGGVGLVNIDIRGATMREAVARAACWMAYGRKEQR